MPYIDTHAHIYGEEFQEDIHAVVTRAKEAGAMRIYMPSTDEASALAAVQLAQQYPGTLYPMLGLHPEDLPQNYQQVLQQMECHMQVPNHPYKAVGEVGLDFYWDASRKEEQMDAFRIQIEWALKYNLPLMIHSRSAHKELIECLLPYASEDALRGSFHCFAGTAEEAEQLLSLFPRFVLGIGGIVTFKKSTLPEVLKQAVPLQRIVLETDSPYMAPVPNRGKRNEPAFIPSIIERLAQVYETTPEEVARITTQTALSLF